MIGTEGRGAGWSRSGEPSRTGAARLAAPTPNCDTTEQKGGLTIMQSKATSVEAYLAELPVDRRTALEAVRRVIRANLDKDYEEGMQYGMIGYYVPHRVFPAGYHCDPRQPLMFAGLAAQKNHLALYLMCAYGHEATAEWFRDAWEKSGKKLDMGKSCLRFKKVEDLALDVLGELIRRVPTAKYLQHYEAILGQSKTRAKGSSSGARAKKQPAKQSAKAKPKKR
jgi:hypothetical protein